MKATISRHPARCSRNQSRLRCSCGSPLGLSAVAAASLALLLLSAHGLKAVTVATLGGSSPGYVNGPTLSTALFHTPAGLALDGSGNFLYVADRDNNVVRRLDLGAAITYTFTTNQINRPVGIALSASGNIYVLNRSFNGTNGSVRVFDPFGNLLAAFPPNGSALTNFAGNR